MVVGPVSLTGAQLGAHPRIGRDGADDGGHLAPADLRRDVFAVDVDPVVGHVEVDRPGELGDSALVGDGDAAA